MPFLDNLRNITQEGSTETRQITPFFLFTFSALFVIFIFIFENGQNSFSCGPPFGLSRSGKYLNFGQKLPIQTARHIFLESRQPEVTKIHIMFCPLRRVKKGISLWTNASVQRCLLFQNQFPHFLLSSLF